MILGYEASKTFPWEIQDDMRDVPWGPADSPRGHVARRAASADKTQDEQHRGHAPHEEARGVLPKPNEPQRRRREHTRPAASRRRNGAPRDPTHRHD